ncbi:YeeE/YedE thiosulfate transporter family protein, partial [Pantoea sp. SIMBA_133]
MAGMIITGLLLGLVLGFVFQRGRFCVTGAFRDLFTVRSTRWLTAFMVIVAVQSVGVFALDALGVITLEAETFPWLGTIIGGLIFGFSIVLAGGCATGTYYRAGEGLVGSWFALIFYIVGATAFRKGPLAGLNTGLGVRYHADIQADRDNTKSVPDYTLVDATLGYDFSQVG